MSSDRFEATDWPNRHRRNLITRHTHQDALTNREFERLLKACDRLPDPRRFEARLICLLAGRLGFRAGEIAHFTTDWIDWDQKLIRVPKYEDCECGYCRRQAQQEAEHNEELSFAEAMGSRWHPKTVASARVVPFDVSLRVELCIERFADQCDSFPKSRSIINRRVQEAAEQTDLPGRVYQHCLRATAASFHSYRGVPPVPLQALMGWSDLSTAQKYIRISGSATARAVRHAHHR